ncbi:calponin [Saitoella coloradoensis]
MYTPQYQASVSSLDNDLRGKMAGKYDPQMVEEARDWLSQVIGEELPRDQDLLTVLKDGVVLCRAAEKATSLKYKKSAMPFVQMENIASFLKAAESLGVPKHELFQTVDLFESKNPGQVISCVHSFSRHASAKIGIPGLGPKLATKQAPRVQTEQEKREGANIINGYQYGFASGSQGDVVFGGKRNIVLTPKKGSS